MIRKDIIQQSSVHIELSRSYFQISRSEACFNYKLEHAPGFLDMNTQTCLLFYKLFQANNTFAYLFGVKLKFATSVIRCNISINTIKNLINIFLSSYNTRIFPAEFLFITRYSYLITKKSFLSNVFVCNLLIFTY